MRIARFVCLLALLTAVSPYRLDRANAQASPDVQQACTPDAMRLCSEFVPDVAKITACMTAKHAQLSSACRIAMRGGGHEAKHEARHETRRATRHEARHEAHSHGVREHCDKFTHLCS
jgi:hypothetical protein